MSASLPIDVLKRYKGSFNVFFETGTSFGDSLDTARECGFEDLYSVELDKKTFESAQTRFGQFENIHIFNTTSENSLKTALPYIEKPVLFFLDAHVDSSIECTPLLLELDAIKGHKYPVLIMIDDMRITGLSSWKEVTIPKIIDKLKEINPKFEIVFEENGHKVGDLLVAYDPEVE